MTRSPSPTWHTKPASAGRQRIVRSVFPPTAITTQSPQGARVRALKAELRAIRGTEIAELHGLVHTPARYIQVLTLQDAGRNDVIERACGKNWPDPLVPGLSP